MPADGWYQVAPWGEFPHEQAGVVQVVDQVACEAMASRFGKEAKAANFAGLLIDFDHFSLDGEKRSEAAGWITGLEARGPVGSEQWAVGSGQVAVGSGEAGDGRRETGENRKLPNVEPQNHEGGNNAGLWAKIRWSDVGDAAVKGGRYRFLSPVWTRKDCEDLGGERVRPLRLLNAAVTNDPNLKGLRPLSNSGRIVTTEHAEGIEGAKAEGCRLKAVGGERSDEQSVGLSGGGATGDVRGEVVEIANAGGPVRLKWVLGPNDEHCPSCAAMGGQVHTAAEWEAGGVKPGSERLYCQGKCHCRLEETEEESGGAVEPGPLRKEKEREKPGGEEEIAPQRAQRTQRGEGLTLWNKGWTDEARAASLAVRRAKAAKRKRNKGAGVSREEVKRKLNGYIDKAMEAFKAKHGAWPETPTDIAEAERLGGMPEEYRSQGNPITEEQLIERIVRGRERDKKEKLGGEEIAPQRAQRTQRGEKGDQLAVGSKQGAEVGSQNGDKCLTPNAQRLTLNAQRLTPNAQGATDKDVGWTLLRQGFGGQADETLRNIGWTDEARAAAMRVRQMKAGVRSKKVAPWSKPPPEWSDKDRQAGAEGEKGDAERKGRPVLPGPRQRLPAVWRRMPPWAVAATPESMKAVQEELEALRRKKKLVLQGKA